MANAYITEFQHLAQDDKGTTIPVAPYPPEAAQRVVYTTSTQSAAFSGKTKFIRVICDAPGHFGISGNPTAIATDAYMAQDVVEYFSVRPGDKIAFYDGTS